LPGSRHRIAAQGVVTLSQIERDSPITANAEAWDFNDLACCSIADIKLIALNVTTARKQLIPGRCESTGGLFKILWGEALESPRPLRGLFRVVVCRQVPIAQRDAVRQSVMRDRWPRICPTH
jgi:hypothetical protein